MAAEETLSYYIRAYDLATPVFRTFGAEVERSTRGVQASVGQMNAALAVQSADAAKLTKHHQDLAQSTQRVGREWTTAGTAASGMSRHVSGATTEIQKHKNAIEQAAYGLSGFSSQLGPLGHSLDMAGRHAQLFRSQGIDYIAAGLAGAGAGLIAFGTKVNITFDDLGKSIQKQAGTSRQVTAQLVNDVKQVSTQSAASYQVIGDAVTTQYKLFHESNKQIKQNTDLFIAFAEHAGRGVQPTIASLSNVMRQFHPAGMGVVDVMNQLVTLSQNTQQPLSQYLAIVDRFGPVLRGMGLSFTQIIGLMKGFADHGITATMMSRGLFSAMSNAERQIKAAQKAQQDGGASLLKYRDAVDSAQISVNKLTGELIQGKGIHAEVSAQLTIANDKLSIAKSKYDSYTASLHGASLAHATVADVITKEFKAIESATTKNAALNDATKAFGTRLGPQMADALWHNKGGLDQLNKSLGSTTDATKKLSDQGTNTLHGQMAILGHDFDLLASKVGLSADGFKGLVHDVGDVVHTISEIPKPILDFLVYGGTGVGALTLLARHTPLGGAFAKASGAGDVLSTFLTGKSPTGQAIAKDNLAPLVKTGQPGMLVGAKGLPTFVGSMGNPLAVMVVTSALPGASPTGPPGASQIGAARQTERAAAAEARAATAITAEEAAIAAQTAGATPGSGLTGLAPQADFAALRKDKGTVPAAWPTPAQEAAAVAPVAERPSLYSRLGGGFARGLGIAGLGVLGAQTAGQMIPGQTGHDVAKIGSYAAIGAGLGSIIPIPGVGALAGGIAGALVGALTTIFHSKNYGDQIASQITQGGIGGPKGSKERDTFQSQLSGYLNDYNKQLRGLPQLKPDQSKQSGIAGIQDALQAAHAPTQVMQEAADAAIKGKAALEALAKQYPQYAQQLLSILPKAKLDAAAADANKGGLLLAQKLEAGWAQFKVQSEPQMFVQLKDQLKNLPVPFRASAAESAIAFSQKLVSQGKLSRKDAELFVSQIESAFPGLKLVMGKSAQDATAAFHLNLNLNNTEKAVKSSIDKMRGDIPGLAGAFDHTKGDIEQKTGAVIQLLQKMEHSGFKPMADLAKKDLAVLSQEFQDSFTTNSTTVQRRMDEIVKSVAGGNKASLASAKTIWKQLAASIDAEEQAGVISVKKGNQLMSGQFDDMAKNAGKSMKSILAETQIASVVIPQSLGKGSQAAQQALSSNFLIAAQDIQKLMASGVVSTSKGIDEINKLMAKALSALGVKVTAADVKAIGYQGALGLLSSPGVTGGTVAPAHGGTSAATGARVPGPVGPDTWTLVDPSGRAAGRVGGGELLIANRHTERDASFATQMMYGKSLGEMVGTETRIHSAGYATGGLPHYGTGGYGQPGKRSDSGASRASQAAGQYVFPFPKNEAFSWNRIDQGQDMEGPPGGPVLAIGPGNVSVASDRFAGFGPFYPVLALSAGPWAGQSVYYGHTKDTRSGRVNTGDVIGVTQTSSNEWTQAPAGWLEFGFTSALGGGDHGQGAAVAPMLHALAAGHMVSGIGGIGGGPTWSNIATPKWTGPGGSVGALGKAALKKITDAANKYGASKAAAMGGGTSGGGGFKALPGGWFQVGATVDNTGGQTGDPGMTFAELLEAGDNAGMRPDLTQLLGYPRGQYGMAYPGSKIQIRMPGASNAFLIEKNDVGSGQRGDPHYKIDLHPGIASALHWTPNQDVQVKHAARGTRMNYAGTFGEGGMAHASSPTMAIFGDKGPETAMFLPGHQTGGHAGDPGFVPAQPYFTPPKATHAHHHTAAAHHHKAPKPPALHHHYDPLTGQIVNVTAQEWSGISAEIAKDKAIAKAEQAAFKAWLKGTVTESLDIGKHQVLGLSLTRRQAEQYGLPKDIIKHGGRDQLMNAHLLNALTTTGFSHVQSGLGKELAGAQPQQAMTLFAGMIHPLNAIYGSLARAEKQRDHLAKTWEHEHGKTRRHTGAKLDLALQHIIDIKGHIAKQAKALGPDTREGQLLAQVITAAAKGVAGQFATQTSKFSASMDVAKLISTIPAGTHMGLSKTQLGALGLSHRGVRALEGGGKQAAAEQITTLTGEIGAYHQDAAKLQNLYRAALRTHNKKLSDALLKQLDDVTKAQVQAFADLAAARAQRDQDRVSNFTSYVTRGTSATQHQADMATAVNALDPTKLTASDRAALGAVGVNPMAAGGFNLTNTVKYGGTINAGSIAAAQAGARSVSAPLTAERSVALAGISGLQKMLNDPKFTDPTARQNATDQMAQLQSSVITLTDSIDKANDITQQEIDAVNAQVAASQAVASQQQSGTDILGGISNLAAGTDLSSLGLTSDVLASMGIDPGAAAAGMGGGAGAIQREQAAQGGQLTPAQIAAAQSSTSTINASLMGQMGTDKGTLATLEGELPNLSGDAKTNANTQIAALIKSILGLQDTVNTNNDAVKALTSATNANTNATGQMTGTVGYTYQGQNYVAGGSQTSDDPSVVTMGL